MVIKKYFLFQNQLVFFHLNILVQKVLFLILKNLHGLIVFIFVKQQQKDLFWAQLELAKERRLPVVIHNRSADAHLMEILRVHEPGFRPWGVMHCFSGDEKYAFECLELGLLISFTGILTFKNAGPLRDVAKKVPLDRVMLETDAPYLAPVPYRGKRNEPAFIPHIAEVLAQIKSVPVEEIARVTTTNARQMFRLP